MGIEMFKETHGKHFLLLRPSPSADLLAGTRSADTLSIDLNEIDRGPRTAHADHRVLPIMKSSRSLPSGFITIGRTRNNDLVVRGASVSKFHAFVRFRGGSMLIQDAGSTNGTRVDGNSVPKRGEGDMVSVPLGAHLEFGAIAFIYIDAQRLRTLAAQATP
jgi:pSer/pThr/pTyr-binding forkhead associated (FHA) protein